MCRVQLWLKMAYVHTWVVLVLWCKWLNAVACTRCVLLATPSKFLTFASAGTSELAVCKLDGVQRILWFDYWYQLAGDCIHQLRVNVIDYTLLAQHLHITSVKTPLLIFMKEEFNSFFQIFLNFFSYFPLFCLKFFFKYPDTFFVLRKNVTIISWQSFKLSKTCLYYPHIFPQIFFKFPQICIIALKFLSIYF